MALIAMFRGERAYRLAALLVWHELCGRRIIASPDCLRRPTHEL